MKIVTPSAEKDPNTGKNKIMIELDEDDVILWNQAIKEFEKYDKDDPKTLKTLQNNKEEIHRAFTLVRPS